LHRANGLELSERRTALDALSHHRQLDGDDFAQRVLTVIGKPNLSAFAVGAHPEVLRGEAKDDRTFSLCLLLPGHGALLQTTLFHCQGFFAACSEDQGLPLKEPPIAGDFAFPLESATSTF
jgi:hypothetical protein